MGEALAIAALFLFSTNIIVTKVASVRVAVSFGFLISVTVNVLAASMLAVAGLVVRPQGFEVDFLALSLFALAGFFSTYLGRWLLYDSVVRLGPSRASTFQVTNPMFTVFIAWFLLGESMARTDVASSVAILIGLLLVSYRPPELDSEDLDRSDEELARASTKSRMGHRLCHLLTSGSLLALTGALCYAVGNVLRGLAVQNWNEPVLGVLVGAVAGLLAYVVVGSGARATKSQLKHADRQGIYLYVASGVLTVLAQACMVAAMRYAPVSIVTLISLSTPILVMPLGYFLLQNREGLLPRTVLGSSIILMGISSILLI